MPFHLSPKACPVCESAGNFRFIRDFSSGDGDFSLYQCPECSVQIWTPFKNPGVAWYEAQTSYRAQEPNLYRGYHKAAIAMCGALKGHMRVVDLGCGTAEFIYELHKLGHEVWGVDSDKIDIELAGKWFGLEHLYASATADFLARPDLPKFDVVTFFEVLEHLDDPLDFMRRAAGLLKPGGRIIMSVPSRERMWSDSYHWDFPPHHISRWNAGALKRLAEKAGLEVLSVRYADQYHHFVELLSMFVTEPLRRAGRGRYVVVPAYYAFVVLPAALLGLVGRIINPKNGVMVSELAVKKS